MGKIRVEKEGQSFELDDQMTAEEVKEEMGLPSNDVLINSDGKVIRGQLRGQVSDGESVDSYPDFKYW